MEQFKLAVLSLDECSHVEVLELLLNLEFHSEDEILEVVDFLSVHRPALLAEFTAQYLTLQPPVP
ncbi:MAG: hypothetical protein AAB343_02245 [Patescibacteria group bacterium]